MINLLVLVLIFLENSMALNFPYNMIALPFLTYLAYQKGKYGVFEVLLTCVLIARSKETFLELLIVFGVIFIISYFLSKTLAYERLNIGYYSIVQVVIYGGYLFIKLPYFTVGNVVIMVVAYLLFNSIFVKILRKKI